jgi:hypothetical protein
MTNTGIAPAKIRTDSASVAFEPPATPRPYRGLNAFYWIAGFALLGSVVPVLAGSLPYPANLGITATAVSLAGRSIVLCMIVNTWMAGLFAVLGGFADRAERWAFVTGLVVYTADGVLSFVAHDFMGVGFHACLLFAIYRGMATRGQSSQARTETLQPHA